MPTYTITITNDMQQQFCINADSVVCALEQAKAIFTESMVSGNSEGKLKSHSLQNQLQIIKTVINPPEIKPTKKDKELEKIARFNSVPD